MAAIEHNIIYYVKTNSNKRFSQHIPKGQHIILNLVLKTNQNHQICFQLLKTTRPKESSQMWGFDLTFELRDERNWAA